MVRRYDHHDRIILVVLIKEKKDGSIGLSYRTEMEEMVVPDFKSEVQLLRSIIAESRFTLNYASFLSSLSLSIIYQEIEIDAHTDKHQTFQYSTIATYPVLKE